MQLPSMFPEVAVHIGNLPLTQTLVTSFASLILFILFVAIFNFIKTKNDESVLVVLIEMALEEIDKFFGSVSDKVPKAAKIYVLFLFVYILWNNLFGLFVDLFATVIPTLHHYVRPVTTDITFNAVLAIFWVLWALWYGFKTHGLHFVERYVPLKWVGIAGDKPQSFPKFLLWLIVKFLDILLGLFIGLLEFIGEFTKMLSLTLRLFWNIFAWVVLITLIVAATMAFIKVPFLGPLVVVAMELLVWLLQAFVFALLVMVYFKLAEESH